MVRPISDLWIATPADGLGVAAGIQRSSSVPVATCLFPPGAKWASVGFPERLAGVEVFRLGVVDDHGVSGLLGVEL